MHQRVADLDAGKAPLASDEKLFRRVTLRLLPFLCLCLMMSAIDRVNISFAKLNMLDDLGFGESAYALGAGIFFVGYIILEVPSVLLLRRMGAALWMGRIMISWGIVTGLMAFVQTPGQFYTLRFLLGVAEAGALPGILFYLSSWFPSYRRGRVTGFLTLSAPLSAIVGGPLSGTAMKVLDQAFGLAGWQWLFIVGAVPTILLGFLAFWMLPRNPASARWLSDEEKARLEVLNRADADQVPDAHGSALKGLSDWRVWLLGSIDFSIMLTVYAISFWLPTFLRNAGVTDTGNIGFLSAIPSIAAAIGMVLLARSSDRYRERRWHIIVPFLIAAAALVASTTVLHSPVGVLITLSITAMMTVGTFAVFFTLPATFLSGPAAAAAFGLVCSLANLAGLLSNWIMGFAISMTGSPSGGLMVCAGTLCLSCIAVFLLPARSVNR